MTTTNTPAEPTIIEAIEDYLNTYMVFPDPDYARVLALWTIHTYTFGDGFAERPWTTPYINIKSRGPQSGKSLLIDLLEPLVRNPERAADMTAAVMFTLIEEVSPTLFLDEMDTVNWNSANETRRGVLNGGYKRGGYIWRKEGGEARKFNTFGAKLLAGIDNGKMPDTVTSRCIDMELVKVAEIDEETGQITAPDGTTRETYYHFMAGPVAEEIVERINVFVSEWTLSYQRYMPKPIAGIPPRAFEIVMPLLQVAAQFGIEAECRDTFKRLMAPRPERDSEEVRVIKAIFQAFEEEGKDTLHTETICSYIGEGWNGKLLSKRLAHHKLPTARVYAVGNVQKRGYKLSDFSALKDLI